MKTYGIVLIGCGHIGLAHLTDIYYRDNIRIIACVDTNLALAREAARRFGALAFGTDYRPFLERTDVDICIIATYTATHLPIMQDCFAHGKHVLCEKPIAGSLEEGEAFVRAVKAVCPVPVTVKIRKGWDDSCVNAVELAKILEANGADAIAIHGRTRQQMYSGTVDLDIIRAVKKAVRIPVIGNGDITDIVSAANMLEYTGCDAVMIGRGAFGNPWLFRQINAYLDSGIVIPPPSLEEKMTVMLRHIAKMVEYKGEYTAMREARRHAAYYTKGLRGGAKFRAQMSSLETYDDLKEITFRIVKENQYDS